MVFEKGVTLLGWPSNCSSLFSHSDRCWTLPVQTMGRVNSSSESGFQRRKPSGKGKSFPKCVLNSRCNGRQREVCIPLAVHCHLPWTECTSAREGALTSASVPLTEHLKRSMLLFLLLSTLSCMSSSQQPHQPDSYTVTGAACLGLPKMS
jgi:hypothetical protein